ncbi:DUF1661 domain-containing protein [Porphyromonas gulae]|nr:DUF1661 domain-containing protein [Porphyromonas gulae]
MVREVKNSRAKTKTFSRRFFRIHAPQSERFRLVFRIAENVRSFFFEADC